MYIILSTTEFCHSLHSGSRLSLITIVVTGSIMVTPPGGICGDITTVKFISSVQLSLSGIVTLKHTVSSGLVNGPRVLSILS